MKEDDGTFGEYRWETFFSQRSVVIIGPEQRAVYERSLCVGPLCPDWAVCICRTFYRAAETLPPPDSITKHSTEARRNPNYSALTLTFTNSPAHYPSNIKKSFFILYNMSILTSYFISGLFSCVLTALKTSEILHASTSRAESTVCFQKKLTKNRLKTHCGSWIAFHVSFHFYLSVLFFGGRGLGRWRGKTRCDKSSMQFKQPIKPPWVSD